MPYQTILTKQYLQTIQKVDIREAWPSNIWTLHVKRKPSA